jgi:hypothetical protein
MCLRLKQFSGQAGSPSLRHRKWCDATTGAILRPSGSVTDLLFDDQLVLGIDRDVNVIAHGNKGVRRHRPTVGVAEGDLPSLPVRWKAVGRPSKSALRWIFEENPPANCTATSGWTLVGLEHLDHLRHSSAGVTGVARKSPAPSVYTSSSGSAMNSTLTSGRFNRVMRPSARPFGFPSGNSTRVISPSISFAASSAPTADMLSVKETTS